MLGVGFVILFHCLICFLDRFEWKLRYADKKLLSVSPESGIIQPNESQVWPNKENNYYVCFWLHEILKRGGR